MTIVDSHAHIWGEGFLSPAFFRRSAEMWAKKDASRTPEMIVPKLLSGNVDMDGDDFVANMDRAGVDASFMMMIDVGAPVFGEEPPTPVEQQIDYYGMVQTRHPGRLYCHVAVDFRRPGHLELMRRGIVQHGLVGIGEITPDRFSASDDDVRPMMKLASDLGVPVQIHTRSGIWTDIEGQDATEANPAHPIHVARLANAMPDLKIVLCHAGFPVWWQRAAELIADLPNCVLDISNWNEHFQADEGNLIARLATWRSLVGADRILFASDHGSGRRFTGERSHLPAWVDFMRALPENAARWGYRFSDAETAGIMGDNALRFYGLGGK